MGLFGGDSSSSTSNFDDSSKVQQSTQYGSPITIKGDSGNIVMTDQGAVLGALDYSSGVTKEAFGYSGQITKSAMDFVSKANQQITASGQNMYEGALATVRDQNKLLSQAYQNGQAGDQTQLKYAGFAVVGLAVAAAAVIAYKAK